MKANCPDHALGGQCLLVPTTTQANLNFLKRLMMFVLFCEQTFLCKHISALQKSYMSSLRVLDMDDGQAQLVGYEVSL
jgi:hypothetical protein